MIVKETELPEALSKLKAMPSLMVCDSQVFDEVAKVTPAHVKLTTFSILMARFKGDFQNMLNGAETLDRLSPGDRVLIAEACTHHPIGEDIGRIQIPRLLQQHVGGGLEIDVVAGRDFPEDLTPYKLIIHCGACMFNRREVLSRIDKAIDSGVPITNYGMAIAHLHGILQRALEPFAKANKTAQVALLSA
jgi:[FeFe] hydrogenase H-cluster maturation GTPase HydF